MTDNKKNISSVSFLFLIAVLFTAIPLVAQSPYLKHLTIDDGLPGATIYNIKQDQKGYIWVATNNGICRYDGVNFRHYDVPFFNGNEVIHLANVDDMVWATDMSGKITYIKNDSIHLFDETTIPQDPGIKGIIQTDSNTVWIANRATNWVYKMTKAKKGKLPYILEQSFELHNNDDLALKLDQDGNLIILWSRVYKYKGEKSELEPMPINIDLLCADIKNNLIHNNKLFSFPT